MKAIRVIDVDNRVHTHLFPERVWEQTPSGDWTSRQLTRADTKARGVVAMSITKNAVEVLSDED